MLLDQYAFVHYDPKYLNQITALQQPLWGNDLDLNRAYFLWKYVENPLNNEPLVHLGLRGDQVVAMLGFCGSLWEYGIPRKTILGISGADVVTHADHRRIGVGEANALFLFSYIAQLNKYHINIVLSANKLSTQGAIKNGFRSAGYLKNIHRIKPTSIKQRARSVASKLPIQMSSSSRTSFYNLDRMSLKKLPRSICASDTPDIPGMVDLITRLEWDGRFRHVRNAEYLEWRFKNPLSIYRFIYWMESKLEGYLVVRAPETLVHNRTLVEIVDLEASNSEVRAGLLKAAISGGDFDDIGIWTATFNEEEIKLLLENGFKPFDEAEAMSGEIHHTSLLIKPISQELMDIWRDQPDWVIDGINLLQMHNWDLRGIYSEGY
jgi:hypothetical protein